MQRFLLGKPVTLSLAPCDDDGAPIPLDAGGTVSITDGAGVEVDSGDAALSEGGLTLSYEVRPAAIVVLDSYRATWPTGDVSDFEVCGGYLFDLGALRSYNEVLADPAQFPADTLKAARVAVEQRFEEKCGVAFVPRGSRATVVGDRTDVLILPHLELTEVYSVTVDGVALTDDELSQLRLDRCGTLTRVVHSCVPTLWRPRSVIDVHFAHGYLRPPAPVSGAAVIFAGENLLPNVLPRRATTQSSGDMTFRITVAGRDGETGIPDVDSVLERYSRLLPAVG